MKNQKLIKLIALIGAVISLTTGCAKTVDCDITQSHVHVYVKDNSFDKFIDSEKERVGFYSRTDEYVLADTEEKDLIKYENKHGLFRIFENKEKIDETRSTQHDYLEYRYWYMYLMPIVHTTSNGKTTTTTVTYIPMIAYSWTEDRDHYNLTGDQRTVHYVYIGYKIVIDAKTGKRVIIESEPVDNFDDLPEDYIYVKSQFYRKVDMNYCEISYEDGPESEHELTEDQQKQYDDYSQNKEGKLIRDLIL